MHCTFKSKILSFHYWCLWPPPPSLRPLWMLLPSNLLVSLKDPAGCPVEQSQWNNQPAWFRWNLSLLWLKNADTGMAGFKCALDNLRHCKIIEDPRRLLAWIWNNYNFRVCGDKLEALFLIKKMVAGPVITRGHSGFLAAPWAKRLYSHKPGSL